MIVLRYTLGLLTALLLPAADFTFGTMLRAGLAGNGDWEMTTGTSPGDTSQPQAHVFPNGFATSYYSDGGWQYFEAGYNGASGYLRLYDTPTLTPGSNSITTTYAAAAPPSANANWTVNAYLRATGGNPAAPQYRGGIEQSHLGFRALCNHALRGDCLQGQRHRKRAGYANRLGAGVVSIE